MFLLSAVFHLSSVGSNMTTLWAAEAGLYVGIDNRGNVITSVSTHGHGIKMFIIVRYHRVRTHTNTNMRGYYTRLSSPNRVLKIAL